MIIDDGAGAGNQAKVDNLNRLATQATTREEQAALSIKGESFVISPGGVTLTSDSKSSILYFKSTEDRNLYIPTISFLVQASTGGSLDFVTFSITRNPTGLSGGTSNPALELNSNFGSSKTLSGDSEIGAEGATTTGGFPAVQGIPMQVGRQAEIHPFVTIPKGSGLAVECTPMSGNTSIVVNTVVELVLLEDIE
jgi:hypothetical protein